MVESARLTEPPQAPQDRHRRLTATVNEDGSITLSWSAPNDDSVTGYQILRRRPREGEDTLLVRVENTGSAATTFTDTNVEADKLYVYRVKAINEAGVGEQSNYVNAETPAENSAATGAPTISGTVQVGETLTVDTSSIDDADGLNDVSYSYQWLANDINVAGATGSSYTLTDAEEGKTIKVRVSFADDAGTEESLTSGATGVVESARLTEPPQAPQDLTATVNEDGSITLSWSAPNDDSVTGYQILRRRPREGEDTLLVRVENTGSAATTFTDTNVEADKLYVYRVKAINEAGVGEQSNYVNVDT